MRIIKRRVALLAGLVFMGTLSTASARIWSDTTGKFKTQAEFVKIEGSNVKLRRTDGKIVTVPMTKLSIKDRAEARRLAKATAEPSKAKPKPEPNDDRPLDIQVAAKAKWSTAVSIGTDGKKKPKNLEVVIHLTGADAAAASHFGKVKVSSAKAGGKVMKFIENPFNFGGDPRKELVKIKREGSFAKQPKDGVNVKLTFAHPGKVEEVSQVKGAVTLKTGGKRSDVLLKGISRARILPQNAELAAAGVRLKLSRQKRSIQIDMVGGADSVNAMTIVDANGKKIKILGTGSGSFNGVPHYSFDFEGSLPAAAQLKITLLTGSREVVVPFDAKGLAVK